MMAPAREDAGRAGIPMGQFIVSSSTGWNRRSSGGCGWPPSCWFRHGSGVAYLGQRTAVTRIDDGEIRARLIFGTSDPFRTGGLHRFRRAGGPRRRRRERR